MNPKELEAARERALGERCLVLRSGLESRDPAVVAALAAMAVSGGAASTSGKCLTLSGHLWGRGYRVSWPGLAVTDEQGLPASLRDELLWLHYLDRADGSPLQGRMVSLRELGGGGLFYHQAFQGYTGDELARAWGSRLDGLALQCRRAGGWVVGGPADLTVEWQVLPRVPLYLTYRRPRGRAPARAAVLFDAAAGHYLAVDAAAVLGKQLVERLMPGAGALSAEETSRRPENSSHL